jgi:hypothetical protein
MPQVTEDQVLLLWRALHAFRSGARPRCALRGKPRASDCPLFDGCPRWRGQPDDRLASFSETIEETERMRATWPCSALLAVLGPDVTTIGP